MQLNPFLSVALGIAASTTIPGAPAAATPVAGGELTSARQVPDVVGASFGVVRSEGRLEAIGPDYKASFDAGRFTFVPAFGELAARNRPLSLAAQGARCGGPAIIADRTALPRALGHTVVYDHGGFVLRYDVGRGGVATSFVFDALPPGSGDLVVGLDVETELAVDADGESARYVHPEAGAVSIGSIVGVDADGREVAGSLRTTADGLELGLPAAFVDDARLPLTIEVAITTFTVAGGSNGDFSPDVAYDRASDTYLAVWTRSFSIGDSDVRGRRFTADGTLLGNVLPIETSSSLAGIGPKVATVPLRDAWVVTWVEPSELTAWTVIGKSVSVAQGGGAVGPKTTIYAPPAVPGALSCDVGGEYDESGDDAYVVWEEAGVGIRGREVALNADGTLTPLAAIQTIAADGGSNEYTAPAISKSNGEHQHWLVAYRDFGLSNIVARRVNDSGFVSGAAAVLYVFAVTPAAIDVDGNGRDWVVVWQHDFFDSGEHDVLARQVSWTGALLEPRTLRFLQAQNGVDEFDPAIAYADHGYVVGWHADDELWAEDLDPIDLSGSGATLLASGGEPYGFLEVAGRYSGGVAGPSPERDAVFVWSQVPAGDSDIVAAYAQTAVATTYCTAKVNSCGGTPQIVASGTPDVNAAGGFTIEGLGAGANKIGVLIHTPNGRAALPFQGGTLCLTPPISRGPTVVSIGGTPGLCDAVFSLDMNCYVAGLCGGNPAAYLGQPGQVLQCQWWGRDTQAAGSYLSNGLEYVESQ